MSRHLSGLQSSFLSAHVPSDPYTPAGYSVHSCTDSSSADCRARARSHPPDEPPVLGRTLQRLVGRILETAHVQAVFVELRPGKILEGHRAVNDPLPILILV